MGTQQEGGRTTTEQGTRSADTGWARPKQPRAYVAVLGGAEGQVAELPEGADVAVGRSRSSALRVDDASVSRLQATLRWEGSATVTVTDHGSRNGTFVRGEQTPIEGTVEVRSGDEVAVGPARLMIIVQRPRQDSSAEEAEEDDALTSPEDGLLAHDPEMLRVVALAKRAARTESNVLLVGETGVGKEVVARRIHDSGRRAEAPFVPVNCGAIPESLAESTLFGHERGAFTGANTRQPGMFEAASGGTLFLDEVGDLSLPIQTKLLRALDERAVTRVGSTTPTPVDVRVLAATNADLEALAREGRFRQDLLYRLDVLRIVVPPLRERPDDVIALAQRFVEEIEPESAVELDDDAIAILRAEPWHGNVRELHNAIERALALREGNVLRARDLRVSSTHTQGSGSLRRRVDDVERDSIHHALEAAGGNQSRAAKRLGISRRTLIYKLEKHGLKPSPRSRRNGES